MLPCSEPPSSSLLRSPPLWLRPPHTRRVRKAFPLFPGARLPSVKLPTRILIHLRSDCHWWSRWPGAASKHGGDLKVLNITHLATSPARRYNNCNPGDAAMYRLALLIILAAVQAQAQEKPSPGLLRRQQRHRHDQLPGPGRTGEEPGPQAGLGPPHDPRRSPPMDLAAPEGRLPRAAFWPLPQRPGQLPVGCSQPPALRPPPRWQGRRSGDGEELHRPRPAQEPRSPGLRVCPVAEAGQGRFRHGLAEKVHGRLGQYERNQGLFRAADAWNSGRHIPS